MKSAIHEIPQSICTVIGAGARRERLPQRRLRWRKARSVRRRCRSPSSARPANIPKPLPLAQKTAGGHGKGPWPGPSRCRRGAQQSRPCSMAAPGRTPRPSRSTSARWRSSRRRGGLDSRRGGADAEQSRRAVSAPGALCRRRAAVPACACDPREDRSGRRIPIVGQSLNNLATLYEKQGRHADSEPLFKRALAIYEKAGGPEHPAVATLLNNLGQVAKVHGPLCRGRAADQAFAGDPRKGAGAGSSRCRALAEQSGGPL